MVDEFLDLVRFDLYRSRGFMAQDVTELESPPNVTKSFIYIKNNWFLWFLIYFDIPATINFGNRFAKINTGDLVHDCNYTPDITN